VLFPGGGESPTFPQVRLGCPSLWSAISGISVRVGRVSGAGLCWRFFNFRFGGAETGSIADRERFAGRRFRPRRIEADFQCLRGDDHARDMAFEEVAVSDCAALCSPWIFAIIVVVELARLIWAERIDEPCPIDLDLKSR
jgi:hypothetical protein